MFDWSSPQSRRPYYRTPSKIRAYYESHDPPPLFHLAFCIYSPGVQRIMWRKVVTMWEGALSLRLFFLLLEVSLLLGSGIAAPGLLLLRMCEPWLFVAKSSAFCNSFSFVKMKRAGTRHDQCPCKTWLLPERVGSHCSKVDERTNLGMEVRLLEKTSPEWMRILEYPTYRQRSPCRIWHRSSRIARDSDQSEPIQSSENMEIFTGDMDMTSTGRNCRRVLIIKILNMRRRSTGSTATEPS